MILTTNHRKKRFEGWYVLFLLCQYSQIWESHILPFSTVPGVATQAQSRRRVVTRQINHGQSFKKCCDPGYNACNYKVWSHIYTQLYEIINNMGDSYNTPLRPQEQEWYSLLGTQLFRIRWTGFWPASTRTEPDKPWYF